MAQVNEWKKPTSVFSNLKDDKNYLVTWRDCEGKYSTPHLAYWIEAEQRFFSLQNNNSFPLQVDLYFELPELP